MPLEITSSPATEPRLSQPQIGRTFPLFYLQLRGLLLLAVATYWALYPANDDADIVAATLAYAILTFLTLLSFTTLVAGARARNKIHVQAFIRDKKSQEFDSFSLEKSVLSLKAELPGIIPFFQYELRAYFEPQSPGEAVHIVRGKVNGPVYLEQDIHFPHRGLWQLATLSINFGDRFGLSSFRYELKEPLFHKQIRVSPQIVRASDLPLSSSTQTSGDELSAEYERKGDYLDIKPYHPSDGTRRILWKIFARSGELLSRHPEKTFTPEGEVLLYLPAGRGDDKLCGLVLNYLDQLEERGLSFKFRCEGQADSRESAGNLHNARALLIESAWQSEHYDLQKACREVSQLIRGAHSTLYIPVSSIRLNSQKFSNLIQRLAGFLVSKEIHPTFLILNTSEKLSDRLYEQGDSASRAFFQTCTSRGWECKMIYL